MLISNKEKASMRKLILQVQTSVDGYIAGIHGEMDFWCKIGMLKSVNMSQEITKQVDCIVLGRKLAPGVYPALGCQSGRNAPLKYNSLKKIVFTPTPLKGPNGTYRLAKGDLVEEITELKKQVRPGHHSPMGRDICIGVDSAMADPMSFNCSSMILLRLGLDADLSRT